MCPQPLHLGDSPAILRSYTRLDTAAAAAAAAAAGQGAEDKSGPVGSVAGGRVAPGGEAAVEPAEGPADG